ncbi:MAG: aldehyde dehydrogenase family protein [Verrucomicrobiota bacterium]|nr:aldehyde dehydrogenase family protein [Verrucomicrobiota bacterium]
MKNWGFYINNDWVKASNHRDVINPATGQVYARVGEATKNETEQAIAAARKAFDEGPWREYTAQRRGRVLFAIAEVIRKHADELAKLETENVGKPIVESEYDMADTATCYEYYGGLATKILGEVNPVPDNAISLTMKEPVGVCGLIIPWNYPALMMAWKVAPALAAGCTMILKPAEQTPMSALRLAELLKEEVPDLPPGVINVLTGAGEISGATLVASPQVDKIAFTGGTETGRNILKTIGSTHIKKVSLELGGKSPNIFFVDADLQASIDGALFGVFINQGEVCSAGSRLLVQKKWHDEFIDRLIEQSKKIKLGDPTLRETKMGPLVTKEHRERVQGFIDAAVKQGANLVTGGKAPGGDLKDGWFVEPTIFTGVTPEMNIYRDEVFGPVVTVTPFEDEAEALKLANGTAFGLAAAVWTRDIFKAFRMVKQIRAGIVWVNTMQPCFVEAPWGGYKQSGIGRELGRYGIEEFLESKQVHINLSEAPIGWY